MRKIYYQLELKQKAPLRIGSGDAEFTDNDLRMDARGIPFIPGSSLAGVLRSYLSEEDANKVFGYVDGEDLSQSHIIVSDAVLLDTVVADDIHISRRDGVGLDEWGTTIPHAKYDFQVVETTEPYYAILEWSGDEESQKEEINRILLPVLQGIVKDGIKIGAKTTRGYGEFDTLLKTKVFSFPEDMTEWLTFDPFDKESFTDCSQIEAKDGISDQILIRAEVKMNGSFNVRVKTALDKELEDGTNPDSIPLKNAAGKPVIPGTAIAGSFRHHMQDLLRESGVFDKYSIAVDELFGIQSNGEEHKKSILEFSEMVIEGGKSYSSMRNAVDRFTAAPRNAALFSSKIWEGGTGIMKVSFSAQAVPVIFRQLLVASIVDLDNGLMTFGGEAGIGRGCGSIISIEVNHKDVTERLKAYELNILED